MSDDRPVYRMPEARVVEIVTRIVDRRQAEYDVKMKALITDTVKETLMQIGLDLRDPKKLQKNFAHLASWQELTGSVGRASAILVILTIIGGAMGLVGKALFGG